MEFYYYEHMNKMQQNACHAMKTGILSLADSFLVPRMMPGELADIFFSFVWIVRRFSGRQAFDIGIILIPAICRYCRSIFSKSQRSKNIRKI